MPWSSPDARPLAPAAVLEHSLLTALAGDPVTALLRLPDGRTVPLDVHRWSREPDAADLTLLERAAGPVLDLGCGPGRLTAALHRRGVDVLGVELLDRVPVLARQAGAPVHVGDVFAPVPREGQWRTAVLADGNIGIGGDAARLLQRVAGLLAADGVLLCEVAPVGEERAARVRLECGGGTSAWFRWALVGPAGVAAAAGRAGLRVVEQWSVAGRVFAALTRA